NQRGAETSHQGSCPTASVGSVSGLQSRRPRCRGGPSQGALAPRPPRPAAPDGDHAPGAPGLSGSDAFWLWRIFDGSCGGGHVHSWLPCGSVAVAVCASTCGTCPRASVSTASPLRHVPPGLPAFFSHPCAVYIRPHGLSHSHTVFCTPHRHREGG